MHRTNTTTGCTDFELLTDGGDDSLVGTTVRSPEGDDYVVTYHDIESDEMEAESTETGDTVALTMMDLADGTWTEAPQTENDQ